MKRFAIAALLLLGGLAPFSRADSFGVALEGSAAIPAGDTNGVGFADLILEGTTLSYEVVVFGIDMPTAMHIHRGRAGQTSGPYIPFSTAFARHAGCPSLGAPACAERFVNYGSVEISSDDAAALRSAPAAFYLNVHNGAFPTGAVRGQIRHARFLPTVGQTPGAAGTHWFTRFAVLNRATADPSDWLIEFLPQSPAGNTDRFLAVEPAALPLSLHVSTAFPVPGYSGLGAVRVLSDEPMEVAASIYNGAGGERGDFGFSVAGKALEDVRASGLLLDLTTASDADIASGVGHRSNIGYFNPHPFAVDATFRAHATDGSFIGERAVTIEPGAMVQHPVFDLISSVPPGERVRDSFWVDWTASRPIFVYATVVNNDTGDAEIRD